MLDWSDGEYEHTAAELAPAAERVMQAAGLLDGKHVLDLGCGTGNAALAAARRGADVVAVDPAARLVEVTARRAAAEGLAVTAKVGDAAAVPAADASFDVVLSVFAVIFAPDAEAATKEMLRVVRDGGRVVLTTWTNDGAIAEAGSMLRSAMAPPPPSGTPRSGPAWGDAAWVQDLFSRHGGHAEVAFDTLRFEAPSAAAWLDRQVELHPVWRMVRRAHEGRDEVWQGLYSRMLERLERGNEATEGWRVTSRYLIVTGRRA